MTAEPAPREPGVYRISPYTGVLERLHEDHQREFQRIFDGCRMTRWQLFRFKVRMWWNK